MNGFLIDTNVLSDYNRPGVPHLRVKRWLETTDRQTQYVSVITLAAIQTGIELLCRGQGPPPTGTMANPRPGSVVFWPYTSSGSSGSYAMGIACGPRITRGRPLPAVD